MLHASCRKIRLAEVQGLQGESAWSGEKLSSSTLQQEQQYEPSMAACKDFHMLTAWTAQLYPPADLMTMITVRRLQSPFSTASCWHRQASPCQHDAHSTWLRPCKI